METADDAGVYRLNDETALVLTADFITPPVDDPYMFGQVAAANALSDVYAMGGRPIAALNLVGFPSDQLPPETLRQILAGALSKIQEAGAVLAGGHSTEDEEPKFGLSVTGLVHPDKVWRNSGGRAGDRLILTTLNMRAAEIMAEYTIHACTDVTGFGLAGHGYEMANGAGVTLCFDLERLPVMDEALEMYERGMTTGMNASNREQVAGKIRFEQELPPWRREIVFDPQTSGGLLAAVPGEEADALLAALQSGGVPHAAMVGEVRPRERELLVFR